jgi:hypothetical protein
MRTRYTVACALQYANNSLLLPPLHPRVPLPRSVREFREMVQALHLQGWRVVLDVVYNHVYASGPFNKWALQLMIVSLVPGPAGRCCCACAVFTCVLSASLGNDSGHCLQAVKLPCFGP